MHYAIAEVVERLKVLEHESITSKTRVESLENWVLRKDCLINKLNCKLSKLDENGVILKGSEEVQYLTRKVS